MAQTLSDQGKYKAPNGEIVLFNYTFKAYASLQDAVASEGEGEILALVNRMSKVDARNTTSAKTQTANGHSKVVPMTPEQKVQAKAKRAELSGYAKAVEQFKNGEITLEQLAEQVGK